MAVRHVDRAVDAQEQLCTNKVAGLLNCENRLRCANAALKREEVKRKESSTGRGAALARAERELLQQDVVLRAFYTFLGKELSRKQLRRALEAGPRRVRPISREELRWKLEDLREELLRVQRRVSQQVDDEEEVEQRGGEEEISEQRQAIEEWKKRIWKLEQENAAEKVEIMSLERLLSREGPRLSQPWQLLARQGASIDVAPLKEKLLEKEKAYTGLLSQRSELQEELLELQQSARGLQEEAKERREELQRLRHGSGEAKRRTSVVHQGEILKVKKELKVEEDDLEEARSRRKSLSAEQKGAVLDGKRRTSMLEMDLERQALQMQKDLHSEEEALQRQQKERLEDLEKAEKSAEAALELSRQEAESLRAARHTEARCLAEAVRLVELGAGPEAAAAARDAETRRWLTEELEAFGPLVSSEPRPQREASVAAVLEARAELRAQQERREALEDEQLTLRQELRSAQLAEANVETYARSLRQIPGCGASQVDLICLRAELTVQKELAEQEVARSRQEVRNAEVMLAEVTEAALEEKAAKFQSGTEPEWSGLLEEARRERRLAEEALAAAASPRSASEVISEASQDWIRVAIHFEGDQEQLREIAAAKEALALRQTTGRQLDALQAEAEALELRNVQLSEQKRDLELRVAAAQFAVKRTRQGYVLRGCPFCEPRVGEGI